MRSFGYHILVAAVLRPPTFKTNLFEFSSDAVPLAHHSCYRRVHTHHDGAGSPVSPLKAARKTYPITAPPDAAHGALQPESISFSSAPPVASLRR